MHIFTPGGSGGAGAPQPNFDVNQIGPPPLAAPSNYRTGPGLQWKWPQFEKNMTKWRTKVKMSSIISSKIITQGTVGFSELATFCIKTVRTSVTLGSCKKKIPVLAQGPMSST